MELSMNRWEWLLIRTVALAVCTLLVIGKWSEYLDEYKPELAKRFRQDFDKHWFQTFAVLYIVVDILSDVLELAYRLGAGTL